MMDLVLRGGECSTNPTTANDCLSCRDPSMVVNAVDDEGRGTCSYTPCIAFCEPDLSSATTDRTKVRSCYSTRGRWRGLVPRF